MVSNGRFAIRRLAALVWPIALAVCPVAAPACAGAPSACNPAMVAQTSGGVRLRGMIDDEAVARVQAILKDGTTLFIDSDGGAFGPATRLGDLVHARHAGVVVEGQCLSLCANYVFLSGAAKSVRSGGQIVFDTPAPFLLEMADAIMRSPSLGPRANAGLYASVKANLASERDFYQRIGVAPGFAACLSDAVRGNLDALQSNDASEALERKHEIERAALVVMSREALERFGVTGIGSYPDTRKLRDQQKGVEFPGYRAAWVEADQADCAAAPVAWIHMRDIGGF